jgi:hypothetical protein
MSFDQKNPEEEPEDMFSGPDMEPDAIQQAFAEWYDDCRDSLDDDQRDSGELHDLLQDAFEGGWVAAVKDLDREKWTDNKTHLLYVNVYEVWRQRGGSEEGGWYYDAGEVVETRTARDRERAAAVLKELEEEYGANKQRWHYNGTWYEARVEERPGENYPQQTPRYE